MPLTETGVLGPAGALVAAIVIGFAFGWFLERAGLGTSTTLIGQFYLRNFTVLKVLFTALVTALIGAFWLDRIGVLDSSRIYLPDTFVAPQAIGGVVFGTGLIVSGLCPGTACAALASGKLDGLGTMAGMMIGIAAFNVAYPSIQPLLDSTPMGAITLTDLAGVSRGAGVAIVTVAAVAMFAAVGRFERTRT
jgi:uncharacterized membrane protein YedE/YeeE